MGHRLPQICPCGRAATLPRHADSRTTVAAAWPGICQQNAICRMTVCAPRQAICHEIAPGHKMAICGWNQHLWSKWACHENRHLPWETGFAVRASLPRKWVFAVTTRCLRYKPRSHKSARVHVFVHMRACGQRGILFNNNGGCRVIVARAPGRWL